ncbi:MAG: hypothetical protein RLZZ393_931, partial [Pseudomonadota bacterium]
GNDLPREIGEGPPAEILYEGAVSEEF